MSSPNKLKSSRKRSRSNITPPSSDIGTTRTTKKATTSTKKKTKEEAAEKKHQQKEKTAARKEAAKARRAELEKDEKYQKVAKELERLKLAPVKGQECIRKQIRNIAKLTPYETKYGEDSEYKDLSIMDNIIHSFATKVDFEKALSIILLHFPILDIIKTLLEKSNTGGNCFEAASMNTLFKHIMLTLKANELLSEGFDLNDFNMLLFNINPIKSKAQTFNDIPATDDYEKVFKNLPEDCKPKEFKNEKDYAQF
ncbi:predicted protein [Chaetoceros tenuissimus]|uniref:Uncharacterized protein n=1 Tax=Chaetoceros tenuissimus TaxID=426638 RepID=A0AAD3CNC2_9STRA|nr:predicted protein [Chaetoceros tenuissimus]